MTPGLIAEHTHTGRWLFRRRGSLPFLLLTYVLISTALAPSVYGGEGMAVWWVGLGFLLGVVGLTVRGLSAGFAPAGTSGRGTKRMYANSLNTRDAYSLVRHPLYLGNLLLWMGTAAFAGRPSVLVIVALVFWVYYERIMIAEESFLHRRFGAAFAGWAGRTPAIFPNPRTTWRASKRAFSLRQALGRDYPAIFAFVGSTFSIQYVRTWAEGAAESIGMAWWAYLFTGAAIYLVLRTLKRRTRLLEPPWR